MMTPANFERHARQRGDVCQKAFADIATLDRDGGPICGRSEGDGGCGGIYDVKAHRAMSAPLLSLSHRIWLPSE